MLKRLTLNNTTKSKNGNNVKKKKNISNNNIGDTEYNKAKLKLIAFPNPAPTQFNLLIQSSDTKEVQVDVYDMVGRNIFHTIGSVTQKYNFGGDFLHGVYILMVKQG